MRDTMLEGFPLIVTRCYSIGTSIRMTVICIVCVHVTRMLGKNKIQMIHPRFWNRYDRRELIRSSFCIKDIVSKSWMPAGALHGLCPYLKGILQLNVRSFFFFLPDALKRRIVLLRIVSCMADSR